MFSYESIRLMYSFDKSYLFKLASSFMSLMLLTTSSLIKPFVVSWSGYLICKKTNNNQKQLSYSNSSLYTNNMWWPYPNTDYLFLRKMKARSTDLWQRLSQWSSIMLNQTHIRRVNRTAECEQISKELQSAKHYLSEIN